jgi:rare lipoprotein A (peptidoglycan hydrolase)
MKRLFYIFLVAFLMFLPLAGLFAQQKFALVIGNGNYTSFGSLPNAVNDANDMTAALQGLGFTVDKVLDGNRAQMVEGIIRLKNRLSVAKDSYGFFFYAGHGLQHNGVNYLIPAKADIPNVNYLGDAAISVQTMLAELNDAGNDLNVVVLDACRDFPAAWSRSVNRGLSVVANQPADSIIVYATSAGSTAADGTGRNGLFTGELLKNIKTPGLDVAEIFRRTGAAVSQASNRKQIPAIYNQFFGTAYLDQQPTPNATVQPAQPVQPQQTTTQPSAATETKNITQRGIATQEMQADGLSASHPSLRIGSKAHITNIANGKEVDVWITGRISASATRIIDLSPGAARVLDLGFGGPVTMNGTGSTLSTPHSPLTQRGIATQEIQTDLLSAAHPTLIIGSRARVTNEANGKEVEVWITDRIAPSSDRIIDLSPSAAQALGLGSRGQVIVSSGE